MVFAVGTKFNIDQLDVHQVRTYHEKERQDMHKILEKYVLICGRAGVWFLSFAERDSGDYAS